MQRTNIGALSLIILLSGAMVFVPLLAGSATATAQSVAETPDTLVERYRDWSVTCTKQTETDAQQCLMSQQLTRPNSDQTIMSIYVRQDVADGDARMTFLVPLRVSLLNEVRTTINEEQILGARYQSCTPSGCLARSILDQEDIMALRAAESAVVAFDLANSQAVEITISLNGFSAAWDRMLDK